MRQMKDKDTTDFYPVIAYTCIKTGGWEMRVYLDLVILLNFGVDFLLLLGTNRLSGYRSHIIRVTFSAGIGGFYAGICMMPGFYFLSNLLWRFISLGLMSMVAFGMDRSAFRRGVVFIFLSMALGGLAMGLGKGNISSLLLSAALLSGMCFVGFRGAIGTKQYAKVQLKYGDKQYHLTALRDSGNTLTDPITGSQVLIVGPGVAWDLMGLHKDQLADPIGTIERGNFIGLRLIPYRAVGQPGGMLLAISMDEVWIDGRQSNTLVAFAPNPFGKEDVYQALTGGVL